MIWQLFTYLAKNKQMPTFTAIDFETAHGKRWSICQIGLVRIINGRVTNTINKLVRPPDNEYFYRNIEVHGITPQHTRNAPDFSVVWNDLLPFIQNQTVVAHNGAFDFSCLAQTLDFYQLTHPQYEKACTYKIYKKRLDLLCREHQIKLNHHDALSDALACAELYKRHLQNAG